MTPIRLADDGKLILSKAFSGYINVSANLPVPEWRHLLHQDAGWDRPTLAGAQLAASRPEQMIICVKHCHRHKIELIATPRFRSRKIKSKNKNPRWLEMRWARTKDAGNYITKNNESRCTALLVLCSSAKKQRRMIHAVNDEWISTGWNTFTIANQNVS